MHLFYTNLIAAHLIKSSDIFGVYVLQMRLTTSHSIALVYQGAARRIPKSGKSSPAYNNQGHQVTSWCSHRRQWQPLSHYNHGQCSCAALGSVHAIVPYLGKIIYTLGWPKNLNSVDIKMDSPTPRKTCPSNLNWLLNKAISSITWNWRMKWVCQWC